MTAKPKTSRLKAIASPRRYHWLALLLMMGVALSGFAWASYDLLRLTMANTAFFRSFGIEALRHGGLLQSLHLAAQGSFALLCWMVFRVAEAELLRRWLQLGHDEDLIE